jgi:hypothetical protein
MLGELMNTIGLILSAEGMISSIRTSSQIQSLDERLQRSESSLQQLSTDAAFIKANLQVLRELHGQLLDLGRSLVAELRFVAPPDRIAAFEANPGRFDASGFLPWQVFAGNLPKDPHSLEAYLTDQILVFSIDPAGGLRTATVSRTILQWNDVFEATPAVTFDPSAIAPVVSLLVDIDTTKEPGDEFQVQFEEEL